MKLLKRQQVVGALATLFMLGLAGIGSAVTAAAETVPAGTPIVITLNEGVNSKTSRSGQKVSGVVASDVTVNGKVVIPKNSNATLTVANAVSSGRLSTPAALSLRLDSINVRGQSYTVSSSLYGQRAHSHNKRNAIAIGGGTAAGAVIGALAGGGKGAAIGAAAGAGAGTAGAALTGKKDISIPAESRLRFTLRNAIAIN
jgi:hypothetical protein